MRVTQRVLSLIHLIVLFRTQGKMAITVTNGDKSLIYGGTINDRNSNNNGNHAHANTNNNGNGQQQVSDLSFLISLIIYKHR